ncbi:MAG: 2-C-methyl-D-erythritol 4-phosphate cytidylyltransferase [Dehalococcoidia bacterium]|jgi:2-C-methyl-D-erythritol 4-phosphate cytidylyltransferase|nr:2-C-methyl-D-erythritol 4-phosphate cytidylyltransferase [Dehalococcoidia bacterium]
MPRAAPSTTDATGPTAAILLAAGRSARMGGPGPDGDKLWADLGGEPLIAHSLRTLASLEAVAVIVLVAPADRHLMLRSLAGEAPVELRAVEGGARRQDSVAAGLAAVPEAAWVLVHDGARPLLSTGLARRLLDAAREHGAAIPAVPVADTLKRVDGAGRVIESVDRAPLRAVQTPQAFAGDLLRRAHDSSSEGAPADATDDAVLVERLGEPVWTVEGDARNLKVTTPVDLALARALLATANDAR